MALEMRMLIKDPHMNFRIERLKALGATPFAGTTNPSDAKIWIDMLEKCFDAMGCRADRKVRLATFLLWDGASDWWKSIRSKRSESEIINWSAFKTTFYEEYYPRSYRDSKRSEFLILLQGSMTVAEYENKYIELSKYAPTTIKDEIDKCRRFEDGLRDEIRTSISVVEWREFRKLVEAALNVERSISETNSQKEPPRNVCGLSTDNINTPSGKHVKDDTQFVLGLARHGTSKSKYFEASRSETYASTTNQVMGSPISIVPPTSERKESTFKDWYSQTNIDYNYGKSSHMKREYPLTLMQRGNVLQGSFSQPTQSKVQIGQGQYMVQAIQPMKGSEGETNVVSPNRQKLREEVGTPRTQKKAHH